MSESKSPILLARLGKAQGVKGEIRAQAFTVVPNAVGAYGPLFDDQGRRYEIVAVKSAKAGGVKAGVILKLVGIDDRSAAEALNGVALFINREDLPDEALEDDEFYQDDLIGLNAVDAEGAEHGTVIAVHDFGAGIVLELGRTAGKSLMIPFSAAAVPDVDIKAGRLVIDPVAAGLVGDEGTDRPGSRKARPKGLSRTKTP